jgi:GTP-binding protein Era
MPNKKSAFAAIIGRPSVGKSTLVNCFCGAAVSIVSPFPQTTRNAVRGIVNREAGQLVFVDTPGRHLSEKPLNRLLCGAGAAAVRDADIILYLLDATRPPGPEEEECAAFIAGLPPDVLTQKTVCAVNKIDAPKAKPALLYAFLRERLPLVPAQRLFSVSARTGDGTDALLAGLFELAPEGPAWYPDNCYTDQDVSFRIAEIVRQEAMNRLREELPHAIYVEVADCELKGESLFVRAFILVEKESQKGMVVGKGGALIKAIRLAALAALREIFDWKITLDLMVKTDSNWRSNAKALPSIIGR